MPRLGDLLLKARHLTDSQLQTALHEQQRWGGRLGETLLRMSYVTEEVLTEALSRQLGIPVVDLKALNTPDAAAKRRIPYQLAKRLRALPLALRDQGKALIVAMVEPQNLTLVDELRKSTRCRISPLLIGPTTFLTFLRHHYGNEEWSDGGGSRRELLEGNGDGPAASPRPAGDQWAEDSQADPDGSVESSFKMLDHQGRTLIKGLSDVERERKARDAARSSQASVSSATDLLKQLEATQRQEVAALRAMVELLIERGVFTREAYLARVRK